MRKGSRKTVGFGLITTFALVGSAVAAQAQEPPEQECRITLDREEVSVRPSPVAIMGAFSEVIGDSIAAEFPEESGIEVVAAERTEGEDSRSVRLVLRTTEAVEGDWTLTVRGEQGACTGRITVRSAEAMHGR